jgi:hypothetical protein
MNVQHQLPVVSLSLALERESHFSLETTPSFLEGSLIKICAGFE